MLDNTSSPIDSILYPKYSAEFDASLIERQAQRENVAKIIASFDLSELYDDLRVNGTYPREGADLSF